ncbi:hypothetical protein OHPBIL_OHPBIL_09540, partial [Dysosmobacter welbionis]
SVHRGHGRFRPVQNGTRRSRDEGFRSGQVRIVNQLPSRRRQPRLPAYRCPPRDRRWPQ